jgi:glycosyltransferase involved in cell wall biosynthesis
MTAGDAPATAGGEKAPTLAIIPWGFYIEDFLEPNGLSLEDFCTQFTGSWMFGWAEALRNAGVRTVLICFSRDVHGVTKRVHAPTAAEILLLPVPRTYRRLRSSMRSAYGRSVVGTFGFPTIIQKPLTPILFVLKEIAPYLATPVRLLARELRREGCGALLCQEYEFPRFDVCAALGKPSNLPIYASFQGGDYQRWRIERKLRPRTMKLAAGVIVAPEEEALRVRSTYGDIDIARIPNPVDLRVWRPYDRVSARNDLGIPDEALVVGWHGRVEARKKGLDVLIDAWARMRGLTDNRGILLMLGSGHDAHEVRRSLNERDLRNVVWVDRYFHDPLELARLLSAADVYAFPSRHEGFPVAPVEAMACGLPLVATDASGIKDLLSGDERFGGVIVPREDPEALSTQLLRLLEDTELRVRLGDRALRRAQDFGSHAVGLKLRSYLFPEIS